MNVQHQTSHPYGSVAREASGPCIKATIAGIVSVWFVTVFAASVLGAFDSRQRAPIPLGVAAFVPVIIFTVWYLGSKALRQFVLAVDLRVLTLAQTWRVGGVLFLVLYARDVLPAVFALPAGWGDIVVGATAPFVTWAISAARRFPRRLFVWWNILGTLDLVTAVTLGVLASASPLGILAGDRTTQIMGAFPLSLIPTFFVPLLLIFHLIALSQVWNDAERGELMQPVTKEA